MPRGQGVFQVSGASSIWVLENNEWHWAPTQDSFFAWGYSWADIQVIDLATFCQYPIGQRLTDDGSGFTGSRGYIPSSDRDALDCSKLPPPPPPPVFTCPHCGATFGSQGELDGHIATDHPVVPPPPPPPPTGFLWIAWPWNPGGSESSIRSGYNQLLSLGINAFCSYHHIDDYKDSSVATDWYDRVYRIANEMGMRVIWYIGVHRLEYKGKKTGEPFVTRYSKFPACGGFTYGDEPNYMGWDHSGCKWAVDEAHRQGASPSNNPMFAVFGYDLSVNYTKTYTPGCEIFDIGCANCYPTALKGSGWKEFLEFWVAHGYHRPNNDGFGDCGKGMIAVIQAHVDGADKGTPGAGMLPDMVGEYQVWKAKYGGQLEGIGFYLPYGAGTDTGFLESGSVAENLRNQIRELTGGPPPPPVFTCPHCGATFSSQTDLDAHIATVHPPPVFTCPHCGATFATQQELDDHIASVHPPIVFTCPHCGATFATQTDLDNHIATVHPVPVYTCPHCGATFSTQAELDAHIAGEHHYVCPHCGAIFTSQTELDAHIASEHPTVYACPHCGATFSSQAELNAHIESEHPAIPTYTCPHCGATFATQGELDAHIASEHPIGEVVPWYKKYAPHLAIGGAITAVITYLSLRK